MDIIKKLIADAVEASPFLDQPGGRPRSDARHYLQGNPSNVDGMIDWAISQEKRKAAPTWTPASTNLPPFYPAPTADKATALRYLGDEVTAWFDRAIRQARSYRQFASERQTQHDAIDVESDFEPVAGDIFAGPVIELAAAQKQRNARKGKATRLAKQRALFQHGVRPDAPGIRVQVNAPAGSGKTHLTVQAIRERLADLAGLILWVMLPDHDMILQVANDLAAEGVPAKIIRGRTAAHPWRIELMCREHETASELIAAGVSPKETLCKICPAREQCKADGYLSQETTEPGIYILSNRYLTLPKAPCPKPDLVIIDETHWQIMAARSEVFPEDIAKPFAAGADADKARWAVVGKAVAAAVLEPRILDAVRAIGRDDLEFGKTFLDGVIEALMPKLVPGMKGSEIRKRFKEARAGEYARAKNARRLVSALLVEYDIPRPAANAVRLVKDVPVTIATPFGEQTVQRDVIRVNRLRLPLLAGRVSVLLLDASADLDINRRIWGERLAVPEKDIRLERNAFVTQVTSATFSRGSVIGTTQPKENDERAAQRRREIGEFVQRVGREHGKTLVGTYKAVAEKIGEDAGTIAMWFGNLRGQNVAQKCNAVVVVGREMPPDAEEYARALYATDDEPILASEPVKQCRRYRVRGGSVQVTEVAVYPDVRVQRVLEQLRERESEQMIDRIRLIHNDVAKQVFVLCSVPLDLTVDTATDWTALRDGGNRFARAWEKGGILPLGAGNLHAAYPELWATEAAAESDLGIVPSRVEIRSAGVTV